MSGFDRYRSCKPKVVSPAQAMQRLEALCAKAERCEFELRQKLRGWQLSQSDSEQIVDSLRKRRFVDDRRYASAFVRDKYRFARWGRRKIELALRAKHISSENIEVGMCEIDETEYVDGLRHIIRHKAQSMSDAATYEGRTRLFRFAASRGFEPELVARIIRE